MANVLNLGNVSNPQHLQFLSADPIGKTRHRMTVYTGLLRVEHATGHDDAPLDIEFPLVGLFGPPPGTIGILDLDPKFGTLQAAVATASIALFVDKTDLSVAGILSVSADLRGIVLRRNPHRPLQAIVLAASLTGKNTELKTISYQVTVLEKVFPDILIDRTPILHGPSWNGEYEVSSGTVGPILQSGVPQR